MPEAESNALIELGFWIASLVLGLISLCLGLGMIWDAQKGRRKARESVSWPTVVGRVIRSEVTEAPTSD